MSANANLTGALYMSLSMAAFTINDVFVKLAAETVPLFQLVFLRGIVTTALLAVAVHLTGGLRFEIPHGDRGKVAWRTVAEVAAMVAFLTALINMPIANATAILSALPLAVTLGAAVFLRHPVGWRRLSAIGIGFLGVMLIVQPGTDGFNAYALFALLAVVIITGRDLVTRTFSAEVPSMTVAVITAGGVCVFGGVMSIFTPWVALAPREVLLILAASVFIIGGYVFSIMVMRIGEIGFTAPFRFSALIFALILGLLVFGEWPNGLAMTGAVVVVATGLFTLWRERQTHVADAQNG